MKVREVVAYRHYFDDFFKSQPPKVRDKTPKTPPEEINRAVKLMKEYYEEKKKGTLE